jgi:hypothetical protein
MAGAVASKIQSVILSPLSAVQGALHIKSPSGWTRDNIGVPIVDGVIAGVESRKQPLSDSVQGVLLSAIRTIPQALAGVTGLGTALRAKLKSEFDGAFDSSVTAKMLTSVGGFFTTASANVLSGVEKMTTSMAGVAAKMSAHLDGLKAQFDTRLQPAIDAIAAAPEKMRSKLTTAAKAVEKPMVDAFVAWIDKAKAQNDAQAQSLIAKVDATFATAQAKVDAWKAKATPTEALLAAQQAQAAAAAVKLAVDSAKVALDSLKVKQDADWAAMIATQQANMASLQAAFQGTRDSAILTGNTFDKGMAAAVNDPVAASLIAAQQAFDATKSRFDQGLASQAEFVAAADALDNNKIMASQDANALQLLDQYNTWQAALAAEAAAGGAITTQQAADQAQQAAQRQTNYNDWLAAQSTLDNAESAAQTAHLQDLAAKERAAKDAAAVALNQQLVARHDRIIAHLNEVVHAHDLHFAELARMASAAGGQVGDNLAQAMRNSIPAVASAASALAATVRQYLKTASPTEKGPMSDLDRWWDGFAPALVSGLNKKVVTDAIHEMVSPNLSAGMMGAYASDATAGRSIGSGKAVTLNQTFHQTPANADPVAIGQVTTYAFKNLRT